MDLLRKSSKDDPGVGKKSDGSDTDGPDDLIKLHTA